MSLVHLLITVTFLQVTLSIDCGRSYPEEGGGLLSSWWKSVTNARIIGGDDAPPGKWPWQVLLTFGIKPSTDKRKRNNARFNCGGTVIGAKWILTAAHCTTAMSDSTCEVLVGTNRASDRGKTRYACRSITHELYVDNDDVNPSQEFDIALIELSTPLIFDQTTQPICLPSSNQSIPNDRYGFVTGYGSYNHRGNTTIYELKHDILLETMVPVIDLEICRKRWTHLNGGKKFDIFDTQICAGASGHGTGKGDSGGPLVMRDGNEGRWYQIGVTSFGLNVDPYYYEQDDAPGVFTRVSSYCEWISKKTEGEVNCISSDINLTDNTNGIGRDLGMFSIFLGLVVFV